jgi:hypothetical protein
VRTDEDVRRMLTDLAGRADHDVRTDRLELVHHRARRTARRKVVAASAIAVVLVTGGAVLLGSARDTAAPRPSVPAGSTTPTPTPTANQTPTPNTSPTSRGTLAPPDTTVPAFASCPSVTGSVVTLVADPDVPSPRCMTVTASQRLRVQNRTSAHGSTPVVVTVEVAGFAPRTLQPGASTTFDRPFGDYLAPGEHVVHLRPLYGGDGGGVVWLR